MKKTRFQTNKLNVSIAYKQTKFSTYCVVYITSENNTQLSKNIYTRISMYIFTQCTLHTRCATFPSSV